MKNIQVYTDGGSRGNPGQAAIGIYIEQDGAEIKSIGKRIGIATNNFAEYSAILEALTFLEGNKSSLEFSKVEFFMDSELAYSQLVGLYKIKNPDIRNFIFEIRKKESALNIPIVYAHIPREKNKKADLLVNKALDNNI